MEAERREHVRQKVSRVEVRVASRESLKASYLRDLSLGGLFVRSRHPLALGTPVVVELTVDTQPSVRLRGDVVRQEAAADGTPRGFGVRFSMVDPETREALEQIIAAHSEPAPADDRAALETQLSESRGMLEAYEQGMALLRESEMDLAQRLETTEAERGVLTSVAQELQARVQGLEGERTTLRASVEALMQRLATSETEAKGLREASARITAELKAARAQVAEAASSHEALVKRLAHELELETEKSAALQGSFEAEVQSLRAQLEGNQDDTGLRSELNELTGQLDAERLKSMALERALQRFVELGGSGATNNA